MDQIKGSRRPSEDISMNAMDGNRDIFNNVSAFQNRVSVHYVSAHLFHPLRMNPVISTSQDEASVHYVPGHPCHPLRMNLVDTTGIIRSVASDMTASEKDVIENE
jgi:hypothetical protein